jgi:hypothetical protein
MSNVLVRKPFTTISNMIYINELRDMIADNYEVLDKLNEQVVNLLEETKPQLDQHIIDLLEEIKYLRAKHMIITNRIEVIEHERSPY